MDNQTASLEKLLDQCIHCGLCLTSCPTYLVTGEEAKSPRGRLRLMAEPPAELKGPLLEHMDTCLDCRACETACPSGVNYAELLDQSRRVTTGGNHRLIRHWGHELVLSRKALQLWLTLARFAQRAGLFRIMSPFFPPIKGLPVLESKGFISQSLPVYPAIGQLQGRVALFTGCVMDVLYQRVHRATVRILQWNGFEVHIPQDQTCCGALHHHTGGHHYLPQLQDQNRRAFADFDIVINNAAGCGAELIEHPDSDFKSKIMDITVFLQRHDLRIPSSITDTNHQSRVVYDAPCHLYHAQAVTQEPYSLLQQFGVQAEDFPHSVHCCGAAGAYSLTHGKMSREILKSKMDALAEIGSSGILLTANPGCQLQLQQGCSTHGLNYEVLHICEYIDRLYRLDPEYRSVFINQTTKSSE